MHIAMNHNKSLDSGTELLVGVCLLGDGLSEVVALSSSLLASPKQLSEDGTIIGVIKIPDQNIVVEEFRNLMHVQLKNSLPLSFQFLTSKGWPVEKNQEANISLNCIVDADIIKIRRTFDMPRIGLKWCNSDVIGFVFVNLNKTLIEIRQAIENQLHDKLHEKDNSFEFRDKHGWPVSLNQEKNLLGWDIFNQGHFNIWNKETKKILCASNSRDIIDRGPSKRQKMVNKKEVKRAQDTNKNQELEESGTIVISYVHGEASNHARNLKSELSSLGRKVFLDADDIPGGQDWQDVLNNELNKCTAFVALVTPRYGETRWTNREAKFADEKEKHIIPISFLDKWPPDQLAIQFLSLQYIPWKTCEEIKIAEDQGEGDRIRDLRYWDQCCVHRVAKEIIKLCVRRDISTPDGPSSSHFIQPSLESLSSDLRYSSQISGGFVPNYVETENNAVIIISVHPKQQHFAENIRKELEAENYNVWCSTDMLNFVPTIPEDVASGHSDSLLSPTVPAAPAGNNSSTSQPAGNNSSTNSQDSGNEFGNGWNKRPSLSFQFSTEFGVNHFSQESLFSQETLTPDTPSDCDISKMKLFRCKAKRAQLVILILSEDYCESCTSKQQAFYCEQRKKVIAIKFGNFNLQCTILNLYQEQDMLKGNETEEFFKDLKKHVNLKLRPINMKVDMTSYEESIQPQVCTLKEKIASSNCVYIIGGTRCINKRSESLCHALGPELAKILCLSLATEGFYGVSDALGRSFCEEREILAKGKPSKIYHIIPMEDEKDFTNKARQSEDGKFEKIPYGQTIYCGRSVSERDAIVSSLFKICILIEGGRRTARLAEKFMWNDCIIIPVISTGRAASGDFDLSKRILEVPCGVSEEDWYKLANTKIGAEDVAKVVTKIVCSALKIRNREKTRYAKNKLLRRQRT